jgi:hypothetical protein
MRKQIITSLAVLSLVSSVAGAESSPTEFSRQGKWDVYGFGQYIDLFDGGLMGLDILDVYGYGGGIGGAYSPLAQLTINATLSVNDMRADVHLPDMSAVGFYGSSTLYLGEVSLDWNMLKTQVTPIITAGAGVGYFDNLSMWTYLPEVGVGVRWDITDHVFLKAVAKGTWWFNSDFDTIEFGGMYSISIGASF